MPIAESVFLPELIPQGGGHVGILVTPIVVIAVYLLLERTVLGYEIKATGDNSQAARIGGINCNRIMLLALTLSGTLAGLAGAIEVGGVHHRLIYGLSPNYGLMAVLIAAVARNNPIGVVITSFFFAIFFVGSDLLQRSIGFPSSAVLVFQGMIFLLIILARSINDLRIRGSSKKLVS